MLKPSNKRTEELEQAYQLASQQLRAISGGGRFGITPDAVRAMDAWKQAKANYNRAFQALREHNSERATN